MLSRYLSEGAGWLLPLSGSLRGEPETETWREWRDRATVGGPGCRVTTMTDEVAGAAVQVRFWGVRGSIPTPGADTVRYGGNTSCVTVEGPDSPLYIFDSGSGIRALGAWLIATGRLPITAHLLLTHTHWDHIQGLPFFTPAFVPGNELHIYGSRGMIGTSKTHFRGR